MKASTLKEILESKEERRRRLVNLSIDEKVDLIEKLHELGRTMVAARGSLPKAMASQESRES